MQIVRGIPLVIGTTAERNALTPPEGYLFSDVDTDSLWFYNGTTWVESSGGGSSTYVRATWFDEISAASGGAGSIELPPGSSCEFVFDDWPNGIDAVVCGLDADSRPDEETLFTAGGAVVYVPATSGLSGDGSYLLSGTPSSLPCAFVYRYRCEFGDFDDSYSLRGCEFESLTEIPSGGTSGQVLMKTSDDNYLVDWASLSGTVTYGGEPGEVSSASSGYEGSATTVSRSDHSHDLGVHAHSDSSDGGKILHSNTSGITANDHHNQLHGLGSSADHSATTLAGLNALISDATLDSSGDTRTPVSHDNTYHSETYLTWDALSGSVVTDVLGTSGQTTLTDNGDGTRTVSLPDIINVKNVKAYDSSGLILWSSDGKEAVYIEDGGNVRIGELGNPSEVLHLISSGASSAFKMEVMGDYYPSIKLKRSGGVTKTDREWYWQINSDGECVYKDQTSGFTVLRLLTDGTAKFDSDLTVDGSLNVSFAHSSLTGITADDHHAQLHELDSSADHSATTLAGLNALISDATLDDSSDPRTPSSHNNTYHSSAYITASGVTFENLSANGDVGTGAEQVSQGNHSHSYLADLVDDTTPQLGGDLDCNSHGINMGDQIIDQPKLRDYSESFSEISASAAPTLNFEAANNWKVTLTSAETTFSFTNPPASGSVGSLNLLLVQNASAQTVNWPAAVDWEDGTAPECSSASAVYWFGFVTVDAGTRYDGFLATSESS